MYGRLFFTVTSASRKGLLHFVDLEQSEDWKAVTLCTCEAFKYGLRPCRHIEACIEAIAHWCRIPEENRSEWQERLLFLLEMGKPFMEALASDSLMSLRNADQKLKTPKRKYLLNVKAH